MANGEVERLNLLVSANGSVLRSEILGALKMKLQPEPKSVQVQLVHLLGVDRLGIHKVHRLHRTVLRLALYVVPCSKVKYIIHAFSKKLICHDARCG